MSIDYLNKNGLSYFWSKLKAYFAKKATTLAGYGITDAKIANGTITLGSNTITPLTSDSSFVHKTGNEVIQNRKAFTTIPVLWNDGIYLDSSSFSYPAAYYMDLVFAGHGFDIDTGAVIGQNRLGELQYGADDAHRHLELTLRNPTAGVDNSSPNNQANLGLYFDIASQQFYAYGPATVEQSASLVRYDWLASDSRIVHTSGSETISGRKIFLANVDSRYSDVDFTNRPSDNANKYFVFTDKNGLDMCAVQCSIRDDQTVVRFRVLKPGDTTTPLNTAPSMGLVSTASESYGYCPTPASASENSTHIATTAWVRQATGNTALNAATASDLASGSVLSVAKGGTGLTSLDTFVRTSGNQEISGIKTFNNNVASCNTSLDFTDRTVANQNRYLPFTDKNAVVVSALQSSVNSTQNILRFRVLVPGDTSTGIAYGQSMGLIVESNDAYGYCPTPSSASDSSTKIATTAWIRTATGNTSLNASTASDLASGAVLSVAKGGTGSTSLDAAGIVTKSGTQEITGSKTFNTNRFNSNLRCFNGSFDISTVPSSAQNRYFAFCSESSGDYCGGIQERNAPDQRSVRFVLRKYNDTTTATSSCAMAGLYVNLDGTKFWFASGNIGNTCDLGYSNNRWNNTYLVTAPDISSDERLKRFVSSIPDAVLDVWESVPWVQYKLADACAEKGDAGARLHSGLVAQRVEKAFSDAGLDASAYGFFCHDSWDARPAGSDEPAREAGDEYSIRYEEALCIEAAYMRRENARLRKRVADLEERLAALELKIS